MATNTHITISIADDHPLVINGIQSVLQQYPHMQLVGKYANGTELLKGLQAIVPDVLLLDIQLPGKTGEELAPVILKNYPNIKILTLTNFDSMLYVNNMFTHGVHGYILKTAANDVLINAIETVYKGGQFIEKSMKEKMDNAAQRIERRGSLKSTLTPREKEILQLIADGQTSQQIAKKLFLGVSTVNSYRDNIMLKLDVNNAVMLVKKALKLGLAE